LTFLQKVCGYRVQVELQGHVAVVPHSVGHLLPSEGEAKGLVGVVVWQLDPCSGLGESHSGHGLLLLELIDDDPLAGVLGHGDVEGVVEPLGLVVGLVPLIQNGGVVVPHLQRVAGRLALSYKK